MPTADVLTVEKYGINAGLLYSADPERVDCPLAYLRHNSPIQRAQDLDSVITELLSRYPYQQVVALGGSEGAVVAHLLAARSSHIAATIAFNGGGQWFLDDVFHSIATAPTSAREKTASIRNMRNFARHVRNATPAQQVELNVSGSGHGYRWWHDLLTIDQLAMLSKSASPTLIIQSGADKSVSPDAALAMVAKLHQAGKPNIYYKTYPMLDHQLVGPDGKSQMTEVVHDIATWLRDVGIAH